MIRRSCRRETLAPGFPLLCTVEFHRGTMEILLISLSANLPFFALPLGEFSTLSPDEFSASRQNAYLSTCFSGLPLDKAFRLFSFSFSMKTAVRLLIELLSRRYFRLRKWARYFLSRRSMVIERCKGTERDQFQWNARLIGEPSFDWS